MPFAVKGNAAFILCAYPFPLFTKRYAPPLYIITYYIYIIVHELSSRNAFPCCVRVPHANNAVLGRIQQTLSSSIRVLESFLRGQPYKFEVSYDFNEQFEKNPFKCRFVF